MTTVPLNFPWLTALGWWQTRRGLWLLGGFITLALEIFSVLYFQKYLDLKPCLYCIYIRQAMLLITLGAFWAAIWPGTIFFRLPGFLTSLGGAVIGFYYSFLLAGQNFSAQYQPQFYSSCPARIGWAGGRWLARKLPGHFQPQGECGRDSAWSFLSLDMAQLLMIFYIFLLAVLLLMLLSGILRRSSADAGPAAF
ncbi:MAG: disulfide bond formation protein B [Deltaproteobacteria bacterium]|jgi:disulfide bond formation protein DsbB|nr:disulfide bond formation protein B [Deltaproteobacteria bacterium]